MTEHNSTPQTPDFTPTGWEGRAHYRWVDEDGRVVRVERYPMEQEVHTALRQARLAHQQLRYYRSDWAWSDVAKSPVVWHDLPESHGAVSGIEGDKLTGFAVGSITWVFDSGLRAAWFAANRYADNCNPRPKIRPIIDGKIRSELVVTLNPDTDVFECRDPLATAPGYVTSPADDEPTPIPAGTLVIPEQLPVEPAALTETKGLWPDGSTSDTGPDLQNPTEIRSFTGPKQGTISFVGKFDKRLYDRLMSLYFPKDNGPDPVDPPEDPPGWTEAWADAWKDTPKPATTVDARVDKFPQVLVTNGDTPMIIVQCNENRSDYIEAASVMAIHWEEAPDGATVIVTVETESRDVQPNLRCFTLPAHLLERFVDALDHAVVWGTK